MSRSTKKAIINSSKARDTTNIRRERHKVKELLRIDPESEMLDCDPKEFGNDQWGTKFDLEYISDEEWEEEQKKARRK